MIREWTPADTSTVAKIERQSFPDPWSEKMLSDTLFNPAFKGFVWDEGEVLGYVGVLLADDAEIALIAVSPEKRKRGIGKKLLLKAEEHALLNGCNNMFLEVRESNTNAKALYSTLGYLSIAIRKKYYQDGENAIVMVKPLTNTNE